MSTYLQYQNEKSRGQTNRGSCWQEWDRKHLDTKEHDCFLHFSVPWMNSSSKETNASQTVSSNNGSTVVPSKIRSRESWERGKRRRNPKNRERNWNRKRVNLREQRESGEKKKNPRNAELECNNLVEIETGCNDKAFPQCCCQILFITKYLNFMYKFYVSKSY